MSDSLPHFPHHNVPHPAEWGHDVSLFGVVALILLVVLVLHSVLPPPRRLGRLLGEFAASFRRRVEELHSAPRDPASRLTRCDYCGQTVPAAGPCAHCSAPPASSRR